MANAEPVHHEISLADEKDQPSFDVESKDSSEQAEQPRSESRQSSISLKPLPPADADRYFANRPQRIENITKNLQSYLIPQDGVILNAFALTEVDHWNHERERVALVCQASLLVVNYSFITETVVGEIRRVPFKCLGELITGPITHPKWTLLYKRGYPGLKITYHRIVGPSTSGEEWNPFARDLSYVIFTDHPLSMKLQGETKPYSVNLFKDALLAACETFKGFSDAPHYPGVKEEDIYVGVSVGLTSLIINQSQMAFAKDRGGIHF